MIGHRFLRDRSGSSAVELALAAPVLLICMIGVYEVTQLIRTDMKLRHAVEMLAMMVASQQQVTGGESGTLADICNGAANAILPLDTSVFGASITSVTHQTTGRYNTDWVETQACPVKVSANLPDNVNAMIPLIDDTVIVVNGSYAYKPALHFVLPNTIWTLSQTVFAPPRVGTTITCTSCS